MRNNPTIGQAAADVLSDFLDKLEAHGTALETAPPTIETVHLMLEASAHLVEFAEAIDMLEQRLATHNDAVYIDEARRAKR